jgi:hypothetical protein
MGKVVSGKRLFPDASHLLREVGSRSSPRWARRASTRKKTLVCGLAASLRFHCKYEVSELPIEWQNCATGALDRPP